jgi:uncharacterized phage protein gp47/JayE
MPGPNNFARMTLPELIAQAIADIDANLPAANARLAQNNLNVLAIMSSGLTDEQLDAIEYYATQIHVTTANESGLERHAAEWGVPRKDATRATGRLIADVIGAAPLPARALFRDQTTLIEVRTTADGILVGATREAPIEAVAPGAASNLSAGTRLITVSPITGVTGAGLPNDMRGGTDQEDVEVWRSRILDRIQRPPQGGADFDYRRWALEFPGVTRAWVYPREQGLGTVVVRFAMDNTYPGGVPTQDDAAALLAYIEARRPVTAEIFVYAPVAHLLDVTIRDLIPRNETTEAAVIDELTDMLLREGRPGGTIAINWIWEAVSIASGVRTHKIDAPPDDVAIPIGGLPILGTVNYVATPPIRAR